MGNVDQHCQHLLSANYLGKGQKAVQREESENGKSCPWKKGEGTMINQDTNQYRLLPGLSCSKVYELKSLFQMS